MYTQGTKYENEEYIKLFRIPRNYISSFMSPGTKNYPLGIAFNDRFDDYWMSPVEGTYVKDIEKGIVYNPLIVNITVTFTKKVFIKSMIYQAYSSGINIGIGYPEELNIYYSLQTGKNAKFTLIDNIKSIATDKKK